MASLRLSLYLKFTRGAKDVFPSGLSNSVLSKTATDWPLSHGHLIIDRLFGSTPLLIYRLDPTQEY